MPMACRHVVDMWANEGMSRGSTRGCHITGLSCPKLVKFQNGGWENQTWYLSQLNATAYQ